MVVQREHKTDLVLGGHFVEFIDTATTFVSHDESTRLENKLAGTFVFAKSRSQSG